VELDLSIDAFERRMTTTKSRETARVYARAARKLMRFLGEDPPEGYVSLTDMPPNMLEDFVGWLVHTEGMRATTVRLMLIGAQQYVRFRRRQGETLVDFHDPDVPKAEHNPPRVLTVSEHREVLDAFLDVPEPSGTALTVMALTGMRSQEVVKLELGSIELVTDPDFEDLRWVAFDVLGKGRKRRKVPMLLEGRDQLIDYLGEWRARHADPKWLFPSKNKKPMTTRSLRLHIEAVRDMTGISDFTSHVLRHTYATRLDELGVSEFLVMQLLGHEAPRAGSGIARVTARHYVQHDMANVLRRLRSVRFIDEPEEAA